jgi:hypothetical protein
MASEISITHRHAFLIGHIQGDPLTGEERHSLLVRMLEEATNGNLDVVIHEDTPGAQPRTATEYIARANFLGTTGFSKRIAYVHPGFSDDTCELIENAAWNHGRKVKLFSQVEDAIRWIEGREDDGE